MNVVIVDDNKIARTTLKQLLSRVNDLVLVAEAETAMDACNVLQEEPVDLLLLDIEMPGMTGLELTRNLGDKRPLIIFTTSRKDYAVEAFELNVVDYIVKPITLPRFVQAIDKAPIFYRAPAKNSISLLMLLSLSAIQILSAALHWTNSFMPKPWVTMLSSIPVPAGSMQSIPPSRQSPGDCPRPNSSVYTALISLPSPGSTRSRMAP